MCRNQTGRRNVTSVQRDYLLQQEYEAQMKTVSNAFGINQHTKNLVGDQNGHQPEVKGKEPKTRRIIAEAHSIPERAVQQAVEFGRGLEAANEVVPGFKEMILSGEVKAAKRL